MRIGVDATSWSNRRGYGRYTRALMHAVLELDQRNQYIFFVDFEEDGDFPLPSGVQVCRVSTSAPAVKAASADSRRSLADMWAVATAMRRAKVDVVYFPTDYTYVPFFIGVPRLVTIHDAIAEMFPKLVFPTARAKFFYRAKVRSGIHQARLLITVSEFSRRQLVEKLGISPERLRVVSEAADPIFRPAEFSPAVEACERWGIPPETQCLIYVGGFSPHKNLFMLLDVAHELTSRDAFHDLRLVLVGDHTGDSFYSCYHQLAKQVRERGLAENVLFTGRLEDEDLVLLLHRSDALLLPSFGEGFGLPAVEAAACGTPVLATTESPIPELLGEGALAISPSDREGWMQATERVLTDACLRRHMSEGALAAAGRLSWQNSAQQLLSIFDEVQRNGASA
jgi:glycosyltransferase involved in cell wall biosynthesis